MQQKQPVPIYYYSESEWDRLGCGPLPPERNRDLQEITEKNMENKNGLASGIDNR